MVGLVMVLAVPVGAQEENGSAETVKLYFDCQGSGCHDLDFFRRQIPYVNWVRDRESADVHVLVTSRQTGGGGLETTLSFIGRGAFEGEDESIVLHTPGDATQDDIRRAQATRLKLGLGPYLADTSLARRLDVMLSDGAPGEAVGAGAGASPGDDPWNFWVFALNGNAYLNNQSSVKSASYYTSLTANRTTELWKVTLSTDYNRYTQKIELSDTTVEETRKDWGVSGSLVRSLGPRWSVGIRAKGGSSTYYNQDFRGSLQPGVEFDFFPYAESSRRSLTLQYLIGPQYSNYTERTIYEVLKETRLQESLTARLSLNQPWGQWSTALTGVHYVPETSRYHLTLSGNFNVRLFKGLSFRAFGSYTKVRDQLYISAEGATDEEILLQLRQLATSYRFYTSFGLRYRFGSIFNNVVNPRFGGSEGDVFF
jgi:hypothetical protein